MGSVACRVVERGVGGVVGNDRLDRRDRALALGPFRVSTQTDKFRDGNCRQNTDDRDDHDQFDQGETSIFYRHKK